MVINGLSAFKGKRVLLLQGPAGPFFRRLQKDLVQAGAQVFKINFNGGDWLFYPNDAFNFRGRIETWPAYFESLLDQLDINVVMLFGDCRDIHKKAHEIAIRRGIGLGVFEEGYIRPNYITLEKFGVNGNSVLPRSPIYYLNNSCSLVAVPQPLGSTYWYGVLWVVLYYSASSIFSPLFPYYQHHRPLTWRESFPWARSFLRKWYYKFKERGLLEVLTSKFSGRYFLIPLQVHNDAQIHDHSDFDSVAHFIDDVMSSFASHAPHGRLLVIKHHPMDRAYYDYSKLIRNRAKQLSLEERCFYIHDQHLPTLLNHACGVVVVNSTVGLSALIHGDPVKTCGKAIYDMEGLTFQRPLRKFWREAQHAKPDIKLLQRFMNYLILHSQINGNFYKRLPIMASATGLNWVTNVQQEVSFETRTQAVEFAEGKYAERDIEL